MSINTQRVFAALVTVLVAAITAVGVAILAGGGGCRVVTHAGTSAGGTTPAPTGGQLGDAQSAVPSPAPAPPATCEPTDSPALPVGALGFAGAALAALAVMVLLSPPRAGRGGAQAPAVAARPAPGGAPGTPAGPGPGAGAGSLAVADRATLVAAVIYVRDRVTSRALSERLATALTTAGVRVLEPAGERFNTAQHEAGGTAPTPDPAMAGTIAAVEVPGYADRDGRLLRAPVVTVYRISDNAHGEPQ